jgi:hypothetical protein
MAGLEGFMRQAFGDRKLSLDIDSDEEGEPWNCDYCAQKGNSASATKCERCGKPRTEVIDVS